MTLVPSFQQFLQPFSEQMTAPTFASFTRIIVGWIWASRHTVTAALVAAQAIGKKHHSAFHRVFANAPWSLDAVGLGLLRLILIAIAFSGLFSSGSVLFLVIDDTLCRRRGRSMFGVGSHYDPLLTGRTASNAHRSLKSRGHSWVILGLLVQFPFRPGHWFCLPLLFRLCLNKKTAAKEHCPYRSRPELARQMLDLVCQQWPQRRFHALVDSAYGGQDTLRNLPGNCDLTARWITNAILQEPAPPRKPGQKGASRKHGERRPNAQQMLEQRCEQVELDSYGVHGRYRWCSTLACLHTVPERLLRILATEPLSQSSHPRPKLRAMFYSTDTLTPPREILSFFGRRWAVEVTIHDAKQQLGMGQPQSWTKAAVQRATPTLMLLYGLVVLWFAAEGHRFWRTQRWPWYPGKEHASFADMLGTLRERMLRRRLRHILRSSSLAQGAQKVLKTALRFLKQAA